MKKLMRPSIFLFVLMTLIGNVSAASLFRGYNPIAGFVTDVIDGALSILEPLFEFIIGEYSGSEYFFYKVLLVILFFVLISAAVGKFPAFKDNKGVVKIIAAAVSIISIRYITELDIIEDLLLSYGVLGIALTTILPFMIYFYFVESSMANKGARRVAFIFFAIVFFVLWNYRVDELSEFGNYLYLAVVIASVLVIFFDKEIRTWFGMKERNAFMQRLHDNKVIEIKHKLKQANEVGDVKRAERYLKELKRIGEEPSAGYYT